MIVWRLCAAKHAAKAFDGEGARLSGGRWNPRGTPVIYTSSSLSLAALEMLVHVDLEDFPTEMVSFAVRIADSVKSEGVEVASLPSNWRATPPPVALAEIGGRWAAAGKTAILVVPSAIIPQESNVLLNPRHRSFASITIEKPEPFALDPRLLTR